MYFLLQLLILIQKVTGQSWSARIDGSDSDYGRAVTTDPQGNVFVAGYFQSAPSLIYDSSDVNVGQIVNGGTSGGFVVKYNSNGQLLWSARQSGGQDDQTLAVATDYQGNVFVGGYYTSAPLIIYDASDANVKTLANAGLGGGGFVIKYSVNGSYQWATRLDGGSDDRTLSLATDCLGNLCVAGYYGSASLIVRDALNRNTKTLANPGSYSGYVVKFMSNGSVIWSARQSGTQTDLAQGVASDYQGNVYVAGSQQSPTLTIYDGSNVNVQTLAKTGSYSGYLVKYAYNGSFYWATRQTGAGDDEAFAVVTDPQGSVFVAGYYTSATLTIYDATGASSATLSNSGSFSSYVVKYSSGGQFQWVARQDGTDNDQARALSTDSTGNVYVAGFYQSAPLVIYSASGVASNSFAVNGAYGGYVVKYSTSGAYLWAGRLDGNSDDQVRSIWTDASGNINVVGHYFSSPMFVYDASDLNVKNVTKSGFYGAFAVQYSSDGVWAQQQVLVASTKSTTTAATVIQTVTSNTKSTSSSSLTSTSTTLTTSSTTISLISSTVASSTTSLTTATIISGSTTLVPVTSTSTTSSQTQIGTSTAGSVPSISSVSTTSSLSSIATSTSKVLSSSYIQSTPSSWVSTDSMTSSTTSFGSQGSNASVLTSSTYNSQSQSSIMPSSSLLTSSTSLSTQSAVSSQSQVQNQEVTQTSPVSPISASVTASSRYSTLIAGIVSTTSSQPFLLTTLDLQAVFNSKQTASSAKSELPALDKVSQSAIDPFSSIVFYLVLTIVILVIVIIILTMCFCFCRRSKVVKTLAIDQERVSTTDLVSSTQLVGTTTTMVTHHVLAVPSFMAIQFGVDIRQLGLLAKGGIGSIYFGQVLDGKKLYHYDDSDLVIKNLGTEVDKLNDISRAAFYQEISLLYLFRDQDQFARMYAFTEKPATIVLKLYQLGSLMDYILGQSGPSHRYNYSKRQVMRLTIQISQGLAFMHSKAFAHCDVKPDNVLLEANSDQELEPRITDFGISRLLDISGAQVKAFEISLIKGASIVYASPEVVLRFRRGFTESNGKVWKAGDVYATSIMWLEMLIRHRAWN